MPSRDTTLVVLRSLAVACLGGFVANAVGIPAGWLSGAMIVSSACAVGGVRVYVPRRMVDAMFVVLGVLLGTGITPGILAHATSWPISLVAVLLSVAVMVAAIQVYLVYVAKWDRNTAFFAALPGALSYVLAVASASGADLRRIVVSQSIRLFLLVAAIPALVSSIEPLAKPLAPPTIAPLPLAGLLAASTVGAIALHLLRVPAGLLSGALLVSGVAYGTGMVGGTLPAWLVIAAYVVLGGMIGGRFVGASLVFLRGIALASLGAFFIGVVVAAIFALGVLLVVDLPVGQVILAFAPGGLDAMIALAVALHMDSTFVAAHQLARFIAVAIAAPFFARRVVKSS
jgi:membrane AbrB-like protein